MYEYQFPGVIKARWIKQFRSQFTDKKNPDFRTVFFVFMSSTWCFYLLDLWHSDNEQAHSVFGTAAVCPVEMHTSRLETVSLRLTMLHHLYLTLLGLSSCFHTYTHTYADTHTCLHASGIKAIWRWCCCVKGFLLICLSDQNDSADTSLFVLVSLSKSVHACEHVCVCACNRVRANVKPQRRRDNCRHKWFYRFFSCYWKNDRIQVHVYIWNITSEEDTWVYACEKQRIPSVSPHLAYRQTW